MTLHDDPPTAETESTDETGDRLFSPAGHPYHYNAWRRKKRVYAGGIENAVGAVNGTPYYGGA